VNGLEFDAPIKQHPGIDGAYVEIPFDVKEAFGAKRVKVKACFDTAGYRGSIVFMGGAYVLGVTKEIRAAIGKTFGDSVRVSVEIDDEAREAAVNPLFMSAIKKNKKAALFWETLPYSGKKKYADWINAAKSNETRDERIAKAVAMLSEGTKRK